MDSVRKRIIQNVEETLKAVSVLRTVGVGTFEPNRDQKPFVGIVPEDEPSDEESEELVERILKLVIQVVVKEGFQTAVYELEDILPAIESALVEDRRRGGLAENTKVILTHWLFRDQYHPQAGAEIHLEIPYLRTRKDPWLT